MFYDTSVRYEIFDNTRFDPVKIENINHSGVVRGILKKNEPMSRHTSWRVGGPAEVYFEPVDLDDLCLFLKVSSGTSPLLWLGLGSNLLVRDEGIDGIVIAYSNALNSLDFTNDISVIAGAGTPCAIVARETARRGLKGAEFLAGIPGCLGGALAMNAGAFGGETWSIVSEVKTVDRNGDIHPRTARDFDIDYRSVHSKTEEWFISAVLRLERGVGDEATDNIRALLKRRSDTQPTGVFSCGSVFRNPPGDYAARLIEGCGLKGLRSGNACISDKHANFIINLGGCTSTDIEWLINTARKSVYEKYGIELATEVKIVGKTDVTDV